MSLFDEALESYIILNKITADDGYGGITIEWVEGARIQGAIQFDNSIEARIGDAQGVSSVYTLTTHKIVNLQYHDVLRRVSDGKIFRITSDGDDDYTPDSAGLNMRNVSAEEWELPNG